MGLLILADRQIGGSNPVGVTVRTAVFRRRTVGLLVEHPVKLGEAGEATGHCNVGYRLIRTGEKELRVDDPHVLDIFCQPETCGLLKLPG